MRPADRGAIEAFHAGLSPETVFRRYFTAMPELSEALLDHLTHPDGAHQVVVAEQGGKVVGVGQYERTTARSEAEVAFVVGDGLQRHGIGTAMLSWLVDRAKRDGIDRFVAVTLATNATMLEVFRHAGLPEGERCEGSTIEVALDLGAPCPPRSCDPAGGGG